MRKKCTCAIWSCTWDCRLYCTYKLTVPAVRTTDDAERRRPREHVPEAASSQQHVAEGGLVSPSCCSAVTVTVKRRTEHSVFDISLSTDILRHSVSRDIPRYLLRHILGRHHSVQVVEPEAQCHHIHAPPRAQAHTPPSRACPAATPQVTQAYRPRYRIRTAAGALLVAPPPASRRKSPSATCADSRPAATWRRLTI